MKSIVITFSLLFTLYSLYAQHNTIHLTQNTHYVKSSDVTASTKMNIDGQDYTYAISANIKTDYFVAKKDSNGYKVNITLNAINTELSSNGVKISFDSQKDTLTNIEDTVFAKPLSDILGKTNQVTIDSLGNILSSDTSQLQKKALQYVTSTLLSGNDYTIGKQLDIIFPFKDSIKIGTTWIDSVAVGNDGLRVDTFTINKIFNNLIYVSVNGKVKKTLPVQQGSHIAFAHFEGNSTSELQVALNTGIVINRKIKTNIHSLINVNKIDIPISSEIQMNEVVQ